jgi:hypothetical protein
VGSATPDLRREIPIATADEYLLDHILPIWALSRIATTRAGWSGE